MDSKLKELKPFISLHCCRTSDIMNFLFKMFLHAPVGVTIAVFHIVLISDSIKM